MNVAAGSVRVDGTVDGDLQAGAEHVRIDGTVGGSVTVGAETVVLGERASIAGDVRYDGVLRDQGAAVGGEIVRDDTLVTGSTFVVEAVPSVLGGVLSLYAFLVNVVVGALLLLAVPGFSRRVAARAVDSPLASGGVELLALVGAPVVLVLVALTIVGIPLSVVGAVLFALVA